MHAMYTAKRIFTKTQHLWMEQTEIRHTIGQNAVWQVRWQPIPTWNWSQNSEIDTLKTVSVDALWEHYMGNQILTLNLNLKYKSIQED